MRHFSEETDEYRYHGHFEGHGPHRGHGCHRHGPHGCPGRRHEIKDPEDLEGLFIACTRMMRHEKRRMFGSSQDRILVLLQENGGTLGQKSLQQLLGVQPGSISEILGKMEEKGLISRSRDEDDKRASLITLTKDVSVEKEDFFDILSEEEKENLKAILTKVFEAKKIEKE